MQRTPGKVLWKSILLITHHLNLFIFSLGKIYIYIQWENGGICGVDVFWNRWIFKLSDKPPGAPDVDRCSLLFARLCISTGAHPETHEGPECSLRVPTHSQEFLESGWSFWLAAGDPVGSSGFETGYFSNHWHKDLHCVTKGKLQ